MELLVALMFIGIFVTFIVSKKSYEFSKLPELVRKHGPSAPDVVCPHCHSAGQVYAKRIYRQGEFSNAKAVAAVLTAGVSLLALGLNRHESHTKAYCARCEKTWVL
jgi:hypothetical protein